MMCINNSMSLSLVLYVSLSLSLSLAIYIYIYIYITSQNCRKIVMTCRASGVFWPSRGNVLTDLDFQFSNTRGASHWLIHGWRCCINNSMTTRKRILQKKVSPKSPENHGKLLAFRFGKTSMIAAWIYSFRMRFDQWRAVLGFERTNPLQLEGEELAARVALVYQQAGRRVCLQITRFFFVEGPWKGPR